MMPVAGALAEMRTCYIPDLPGFGETPPPPEPWSVDDYVDFAETFTAEIIGEQTDILGHSFGGRMIIKWCVRESAKKQLRHIVITGGAGMKPRRTLSYYYRRTVASILKAPFMLLPDTLKEKALNWLRGTRAWKSLGSSDYRQLDGVMRMTFIRTVSEHLERCLPEIDHDILLLWGKDDQATPWYQAERMEKGLQNGALVGIDHAGHYAFLDQPARFISIVKAFYGQNS